jgi:hypothetical protein
MMTERQFQVAESLERLLHRRLTEQELNERLSKIFNKRIEVEQGQYDDDWIGDDYKTFSVDDEEIGGYFDIYYMQMPRIEELCYITEVNYYFE